MSNAEDTILHPPFAHPISHGKLEWCIDGWRDPQTGTHFPLKNGVPVFIPSSLQKHMEKERLGFENTIKVLLRNSPWLYRTLISVISPVCFVGMSPRAFLRRFHDPAIVLNIGSGVHRYGPNVLNVDVFPYRGVDVVADAGALPFATNSMDGAICECLLEHVPDPQRVVQEILRVLRPGGEAYLSVPFVYPFHASPNDFYRWSEPGLRCLCRDTEIEIIAPRSGPTSALTAQLVTWTSITFSFGWSPLYHVLSSLLLLVFFPLKFLDLIVGQFPTAVHGPATWYVVLRKPLRDVSS